jgi:hypothetical protein
MSRTASCTTTAALVAASLLLSACGGVAPAPSAGMTASKTTSIDRDSLASDVDPPDGPSILAQLNTETTIGSTVDPVTGDQNPYGLDISPIDSGLVHRGDLIVCDFNDSANVQGTGNAIIALAPQPGSSPRPVITNGALLGCTENVQTGDGRIWVTAFVAPDVAEVSTAGALLRTLKGSPFTAPFGLALAQDTPSDPTFYEGDATTGDIIRIQVGRYGITATVIATGFAVNNGVPGTELGPGGLQYDAAKDRLYVVDGTNNTLVELRHVSTIPAYGVAVNPDGSSFSGPFAHRARLVFSGSPLNAPISSALFPNGNIVIGNTGNPNGFNLMVEITPHGKVAYVRNVDTGASGAIFGMVSATNGFSSANDVKLYFNDDNSNTVIVLTK